MKKKPKNFIVSLVVYPFDVMFSLGESDASFDENLKSHLLADQYDKFKVDSIMTMENKPLPCGRTVRLRDGQTVIRIVGEINNPVMHGTLAHEIFHAVEFLFRRIEIKLCDKSDEAYAYAIGYLTEKFYENLK